MDIINGRAVKRWLMVLIILFKFKLVLKKARELICYPNYEDSNPSSPLVQVLNEKGIDFKSYYKNSSVKVKVDKEIQTMLYDK